MYSILHELADPLKLLMIPLLLLGFHHWQRLSRRWKMVWFGLVLINILYSIYSLFVTMYRQVVALPEWDFRWFWIYGRVAVQGLNFSDPEYARQLAQSLNSTPEFISQLDFSYLPPTIFLFSWLGWFDLRTAYVFWYGLHSAILILDIYLLWKVVLGSNRLINLMLVAALLLRLPGTQSTIFFGQTNLLLLLLLLLFWRNQDRLRGGIWLALGVLTKPLLALMLLYPVLKRHWRVLLGFTIALTVASLLTIAVFGSEPFFSYFSQSPGATRPNLVYVESVNQSLLATVLRLTQYDFSQRSPLTQPLFVGLALGLTGVTGWLIYRLDQRDTEWSLAMTLLLSLLLYPGTLIHYSVHLIIPILLLLKYRNQLVLPAWSIIIFITLQYSLTSYLSGTFIAFLLSWLLVVTIAIWRLAQSVPKLKHQELSD